MTFDFRFLFGYQYIYAPSGYVESSIKTKELRMTPSEREDPRISLNKLGEYLVAEPRQRRRLLRDQKFPPTIPVIYYEPVTKAIARYFDQGATDDQLILEAIGEIEGETPDSDFEHHRQENCVLALESFLDALDNYSSRAEGYRSAVDESALYSLGGVEISIRPEVLSLNADGEVVGATKLYFGKHDPLTERSAKLIATMMYLYLTYEYGDQVQKSETAVVDVFDTSVTKPPRSYQRRSQDLEAACREIAALWSGIQEDE